MFFSAEPEVGDMKNCFYCLLVSLFLVSAVNVSAEQIIFKDERARPEKPVIPYPDTAEKWQMEIALEKSREYNQQMAKYLAWLRQYHKSLVQEANSVNAELNEAIKRYNEIHAK
jgi:hypothetical protein